MQLHGALRFYVLRSPVVRHQGLSGAGKILDAGSTMQQLSMPDEYVARFADELLAMEAMCI